MSEYGPRPWVQRHWDLRAAANFMLGGTGAGLLIAAALVMPSPRFAMALALVFVAGGLAAVWLEIGRKLRATHVFFNPRTSWMSRESLVALALFPLGVAALANPQPWLLGASAAVAFAFVYCQARILRASKGIPAWRAPEVVPLIVTSALAEGAAAALVFETGPLAPLFLGFALAARALAWFLFRKATRSERGAAALEHPGNLLLALGTALPLALIAAADALPLAAPLAAAASIGTGWWLKFALVTRAAFNQGFAVPHLPVRGTR